MITSPTIFTFSGALLAPMAPDPATICIEDIAHALSLQCRFGGHVREFYSVAQHSVLVSYLCEPADALHGLLHDASEAYLADIVRPVKHLTVMDAYRACEAHMQAVIYRRFGLSAVMPESVETADDLLLVTEACELLPTVPAWTVGRTRATLRQPIVGWHPAVAERKFLARFAALSKDSR